MRRVKRPELDAHVQAQLNRRQRNANETQIAGTLDAEKVWESARRTKAVISVVNTLQQMMGATERCMYCHDSHGTDIDHFWPKSNYSSHMFSWPNLLLCCTQCGRIKGNKFPLGDDDVPLLIDPTREEPWIDLDFDSSTGNIVARYDLATNDYRPKGISTVDVLQLDRREGMAAGLQKTFGRLKSVFSNYLAGDPCTGQEFYNKILEADDHGLRGWCFLGTGYNVEPFKELYNNHRNLWDACVEQISIND